VKEQRFVHIRHAHMAGLELSLRAENWSGRLEIRSAIDGAMTNSMLDYDQSLNNRHLDVTGVGSDSPGSIWLTARTRQSRIDISTATRTRVRRSDTDIEPGYDIEELPESLAHSTSLDVAGGDTITIEKLAAIFTSRDPSMSESEQAARLAIARAPGFGELLEAHIDAWDTIWQRCNIDLEDGSDDAQITVRLHLFHILQTVSEHTRDLDVGSLARGLTGEDYYGHIFWDELFVLPFLNFHFPDISRALLRYRFLRLNEARHRACEAGYQGAMFPWRSGSSGREVTPPFYPNTRTETWIPDYTWLQRHVGSAIAYNVWHYYEVTRDDSYLITEGAEMLLEIARFWSSIATLNEELDRYEIHGATGPDEFHTAYPWADEPGLSNNTYTNIMAVWTLRVALATLDQLPPWRRDELRQKLDLDDDDFSRWNDIARRMRIVFLESGELAQFEHYDRLKELDWGAYREKYEDIQRPDLILDEEGDTPNAYKIAKQPDVLMLSYLFPDDELFGLFRDLGYELSEETWKRTIDYYLQRTTGGSTLSRVVQAEIFAGADKSRSWQCLLDALQSDVGDIQSGSSENGLHLGAMGGTIEIIERRYTGIDARGDILHFNPALPDELKKLSMRLYYRGSQLSVTVTHRHLHIETDHVARSPLTIALADQRHELVAGTPIDLEW
jgi:alpha,alpha-trehalase